MQSKHFFALTFTLCLAASAPAEDALRGAASILDELDAQRNAEVQKPDKPPDETAKLRADLAGFTARAATLAPADAAREWLALADRFAKLPTRDRLATDEDQNPPMQHAALFAALPPPAAWDDLARVVAARRAPESLKDTHEISLRMLTQTLIGDRAALAAQSSALDKLLRKAKRDEAMPLADAARKITELLLALSDDPKAILSGVEMQLRKLEREDAYGYSAVDLPDLVEIIGEAQATPVLERALKSKAQRLSIRGKATNALASKLALKLINELTVPRWEQVNSPDAVELYEALEKKFVGTKPAAPEAQSESSSTPYPRAREKKIAQTYYLMGLIVRGRTAEAAKFARALNDQEDAS